MVFVQANAGVIQQLTVDAVNVSVGSGLVDPIRAVDKGAPLAIVRIEMQRPPYALLAKPAIKSIKDLKGKIVSVGGAEGHHPHLLRAHAGAERRRSEGRRPDLCGRDLGAAAALQSGAADAAILTAPYNFHAEAAGFTNLGLPSDVVDMPFSGVSTNRNWAQSHKDALREVPRRLHQVDRLAVRSGQSQGGGRPDGVGEQAQPRRRREELRFPHQERLSRADRRDLQGEARQGGRRA